MRLLDIVIIAVALAMDAFAVAIATGVNLKKVDFRQHFRLGWHFALFQFLMPVIGWRFGMTIRSVIEDFDHWVAFGLLAFVGVNMIRSALKHEEEDAVRKDPTKGASLVMLSVATSIDALAVGLSLAMVQVSIWKPSIIIGIVAGGFTLAGLRIGSRLGSIARLTRYAEGAGGLVLLVIGAKILHEHGVFAAIF